MVLRLPWTLRLKSSSAQVAQITSGLHYPQSYLVFSSLFHSDLPTFNLKLAAGVHTKSHGSGNLEQELGDRLLRLCWPMDSSEVENQQG